MFVRNSAGDAFPEAPITDGRMIAAVTAETARPAMAPSSQTRAPSAAWRERISSTTASTETGYSLSHNPSATEGIGIGTRLVRKSE